MKFTEDQIEALVYIFERDNGNEKSDFELEVIEKSELMKYTVKELEEYIIEGLNLGMYNNSTLRIGLYFALGKRFNHSLIPLFQKWLRNELELNDSGAVYQLLISLGNVEEQVFSKDRDGISSVLEIELNIRDAKDYLNKYSV